MGLSDWLVIGLSGCTCSGKTTIAKMIHNKYPDSVLLHQDDHFHDVKSDKHVKVPELDHINFEILSSLDNDSFYAVIMKTFENSQSKPRKLCIIEGFLVLNEPRLVDLCDVKFFITSDRETCWNRRSARTYDPPDPPGYFDLCVWPKYLEHYNQVVNNVEGVVFLDSATKSLAELEQMVLKKIREKLDTSS